MYPVFPKHGFKDLPDNWSMLTRLKSALPGAGYVVTIQPGSYPAYLLRWSQRLCRSPRYRADPHHRLSDYVPVLHGVTRGKCNADQHAVLLKHHYDANMPLAQVMPEPVQDYPDTYANMAFATRLLCTVWVRYVKCNRARLNARRLFHPQAGCGDYPARRLQRDCRTTILKWWRLKIYRGRIAANSVIPYPPESRCCSPAKTFGDETVRGGLLTLTVTRSSLPLLYMKPKARKLLMAYITLCA